jgi:hypothetical protein
MDEEAERLATIKAWQMAVHDAGRLVGDLANYAALCAGAVEGQIDEAVAGERVVVGVDVVPGAGVGPAVE